MSLPAPDSPEHLIALLEEAGATLMAAAVRGTRPAGARSFWPEVLRSAEELAQAGSSDLDRPGSPSARAITRMDSAHDWIRLIPLDPARPGSGMQHSPHGGATLRRIVWLRSLVNPRTGRHVYSWRKLGTVLRSNHESVRSWHAQGISLIYRRLVAAAAPASDMVHLKSRAFGQRLASAA